MQVIRGNQIPFTPASHENLASPGVLKRVLATKSQLIPGRIQMVNWSLIAAGNSFQRHFHEDMQEVFIILDGQVEMTVGDITCHLDAGDAVIIGAMEVHKMSNRSKQDVNYIVFGISTESGGKTVVCE